jgi:hypothetical protein
VLQIGRAISGVVIVHSNLKEKYMREYVIIMMIYNISVNHFFKFKTVVATDIATVIVCVFIFLAL